MGVPDSFGSKVGGDPVPFSLRDCTDRTRCGIGLGHAGSGWKAGAFGLREAEGLSGSLLPSSWWSLPYIPNMPAFQPHPTRFVNRDRCDGDSVTQFAQHSKPSGYWSASQVEVGVSWLFGLADTLL